MDRPSAAKPASDMCRALRVCCGRCNGMSRFRAADIFDVKKHCGRQVIDFQPNALFLKDGVPRSVPTVPGSAGSANRHLGIVIWTAKAQTPCVDPGHTADGSADRDDFARADAFPCEQGRPALPARDLYGRPGQHVARHAQDPRWSTMSDAQGTAATRLLMADASLKDIATAMGWSIKHAAGRDR